MKDTRLLSQMVVEADIQKIQALRDLQSQIQREFGEHWRESLMAKKAFYEGHFRAYRIKVRVEVNFDRDELKLVSDAITMKEKDNVKSRWNQFKRMECVNPMGRSRTQRARSL